MKNILVPGGKVLLVLINQNNHYPAGMYNLKNELAYKINNLTQCKFDIEAIDALHDNFTFYGSFVSKLINHIFQNRYLRLVSFVLISVPASIICLIRNFLSLVFKHREGIAQTF